MARRVRLKLETLTDRIAPAAGALDLSFGGTGKLTTPIGSSADFANSMAVQADGKIVVAGSSYNGSNDDFALARYNADGSLDTSFSADGKLTTAIGSAIDVAYCVAMQVDGKIVVAGSSYNGSNEDFALARYNADGSLDTSFSGDGKLTIAIASADDVVKGVAIQADGRIVVAGFSNYGGPLRDFSLARVNTDGSLDTSFDGDGRLTTDFASTIDEARCIALQADGKIVLAGYASDFSNLEFALARYNADGSLDTTFDNDGKSITSVSSLDDDVRSIAIQPDGKIVVAGGANNGSNDDFALARYNSNGSLDNSFDGDGIVTTPIGPSHDYIFGLALQADGKIVAAGTSNNGTNYDFELARYNANGSLDLTFDGDGKLSTPIGSGDEQAYTVAVQPDGKIVAAGYSSNGGNADIALARYRADGSLDLSFNGPGKVTTPIGASDDSLHGIAAQADGKIVVAGYSNISGNDDFSLTRYHTDGSLDTSFDGDGKLMSAIGSSNDLATTVAVQPDGKIVVAGFSQNGSDTDFALARYHGNGSPDAAFDFDGKLTTSLGSFGERVFGVAIQSDGKIIVAGNSDNGANNDFALARYNSNGSLDTSFDLDGTLITSFGSSHDVGFSIALQSDGKIVVAGSSRNANSDLALARYNSDGSLDTTFDLDGKLTTDFGGLDDESSAVAIQTDGKIVAVGYSWDGFDWNFAAARYNSDGTLDTSFDGDGRLTTPVSLADDLAASVLIQADGKILAAGYAFNGINRDFAAVRYNPDGSLDTTFDGDGKLMISVGSNDDDCRGTLLQPDGRIVVAGSSSNGSNVDFALIRLKGDNRSPQATPDTIVLSEDPASPVSFSVMANDSDPDNDSLVVNVLSQPAHGKLFALGGGFQYQPDAHYNGTDSFSYKLADDSGAFDTAQVQLIVQAVNDAPTVTDAFLPSIIQANPNPPGRKLSALFAGLVTDADVGASLSGVAVVGNSANPATEGTWQYSTDNGTNWFDVGTVADDTTALALSASTRIRFLSLPLFDGSPTPLTIRAHDNSFAGAFTSGGTRQTVNPSPNGDSTPIAAATSLIETMILPDGAGGNTTPTLTGVPVSVNLNEGQTLSFTASSYEPDAGQTPTFSLASAPAAASIDPDSGEFSWITTEADGPNTYVFNVHVTDGIVTVEKTVTVIVSELNTAPVLADVPATAKLIRGESLNFTATATDDDLLNGLPNTRTFSLIGAPSDASIHPDTGVFSWTPSDMLSPGIYSFDVRVADDGVPSKSAILLIDVTVEDAYLLGGNLMIGGTAGNDTITVNPSKDLSQLIVKLGKTTLGTYTAAAVNRIEVRGLGGNDKITVNAKITKPVDLYGGFGNDVLKGGSGDDRLFGEANDDRLIGGKGNNLLVGGSGNDKLTGGTGRDVLIGGAGSDKLAGGGSTGEDLLIGGSTSFDTDLTGLTNIFIEWNSTSIYEDRIAHLQTGGGLNGTTFLSVSTVQDIDKDTLTGAGGLDWFLVSLLDKLDLKPGELLALMI